MFHAESRCEDLGSVACWLASDHPSADLKQPGASTCEARSSRAPPLPRLCARIAPGVDVAVLDASVIAELLIGSALGRLAAQAAAAHAGDLHIPDLAVVETTSVLLGWVLAGDVADDRARAALVDLGDLPARRWPAEPLMARIWALRQNVTAYDATNVALAAALGADLMTGDERLAGALAGGEPLQRPDPAGLVVITQRATTCRPVRAPASFVDPRHVTTP